MSNPRTHAELIKAWADGAEIEWFYDGAWISIGCPSFLERNKYRIKPQPIVVRYRRYFWGHTESKKVIVGTMHFPCTHNPEEGANFIRWIDNDWIEEEV